MTKYILHGGGTNLPLKGNKEFYKTIVSGSKGPVKLLLVYYSRAKDEWPKLFEKDKENFSAQNVEKQVELSIADPDLNIFREQLKNTDAIYVRGGNTFQLLEKIKQVPEFVELIKNKVYSGSSAGMYLVCKYFYENDFDKIGEGLGIFPVKAFAHWKGEEDILKRLKETGEDLPIYKLAEGETIILEK